MNERSTADRRRIAAKGSGNLPAAEQRNAVKVADFAQSAAQGGCALFCPHRDGACKTGIGYPYPLRTNRHQKQRFSLN